MENLFSKLAPSLKFFYEIRLNYIPRAIPTNRSSFTEEAIEVGAPRGLWLGGSWRYIAGGLYRGSYRSRGPERAVAGRQVAVYSSRALQRKGGRGGAGGVRRT